MPATRRRSPQTVGWICSAGTPRSIRIRRTSPPQTTGAPVRHRDLRSVAEMVVRGVRDEDHVGPLEVLVPARRERAAREEGVDQDPVVRGDDLVAGNAEKADPGHRCAII